MTDRSADDATVVEVPDGGADDELVLPAPVDPGRGARTERAALVVEQARAGGGPLIGPEGVLAELTKLVLEAGLEVEMDEHLGYAKHSMEGRNGGTRATGHASRRC